MGGRNNSGWTVEYGPKAHLGQPSDQNYDTLFLNGFTITYRQQYIMTILLLLNPIRKYMQTDTHKLA